MSLMLQIKELLIGYQAPKGDKIPLLPPINLKLEKGKVCGLIGANGAGKTTLLRTVTGYIKPLGGTIFLNGKSMASLSNAQRAKYISVVLTDRIEDPFLQVGHIVSMGRHPYTGFMGKLQVNDEMIVQEAMELVGISHLQSNRMTTLSDGERQKVMIAKALAQNTPLIILDEPAAFLDYPSRIELMLLLKKLAYEKEKTILLSSHDLEILMRNADQLWLIARGKPAVEGLPEQLILDGRLNTYFGSADLFISHDFDDTKQMNLSGTVFVESDKKSGFWIKNALSKRGFVLSQNPESFIHINYQNNAYVIKNKNEVVCSTGSLAKLLEELSKILP
jgi:iron complex transport system ATP-binding protein